MESLRFRHQGWFSELYHYSEVSDSPFRHQGWSFQYSEVGNSSYPCSLLQ
jgi:hypothetical protein